MKQFAALFDVDHSDRVVVGALRKLAKGEYCACRASRFTTLPLPRDYPRSAGHVITVIGRLNLAVELVNYRYFLGIRSGGGGGGGISDNHSPPPPPPSIRLTAQ